MYTCTCRDEILEYEGKDTPIQHDEMVEVDGSGEIGAVGGDGGEKSGVGETEQEGGEVEIMKDESETRLGPPGPPFGIVINGHSLVSMVYVHVLYIPVVKLQ